MNSEQWRDLTPTERELVNAQIERYLELSAETMPELLKLVDEQLDDPTLFVQRIRPRMAKTRPLTDDVREVTVLFDVDVVNLEPERDENPVDKGRRATKHEPDKESPDPGE